MIVGAAQNPRSWPWAENPDGARSIDQAVTIARQHGVTIPEYLELALLADNPNVDPGIEARYFRWSGWPHELISWTSFFTALGKIQVYIKP